MRIGGGLATAMLCCLATAPASQATPKLSLTVRARPIAGFPDTGNVAGAGAVLALRLGIADSEHAGDPPPLTRLLVGLPPGTRWDPRGFPKCPPQGQPQPLRSALFPWCPLKTRTEQNTRGELSVAFGSTIAPESVSFEPFYDTKGGESFNVEGHDPVQLYFFANGAFHRRSSGEGQLFDLRFPLVETFPGGPWAAITEMSIDLGSARTSRDTRRDYFSLRMPSRCPHGALRFSVEATFGAGTTAEAAAATYGAPCPRRVRTPSRRGR